MIVGVNKWTMGRLRGCITSIIQLFWRRFMLYAIDPELGERGKHNSHKPLDFYRFWYDLLVRGFCYGLQSGDIIFNLEESAYFFIGSLYITCGQFATLCIFTLSNISATRTSHGCRLYMKMQRGAWVLPDSRKKDDALPSSRKYTLANLAIHPKCRDSHGVCVEEASGHILKW